jgi:hypothetical protein
MIFEAGAARVARVLQIEEGASDAKTSLEPQLKPKLILHVGLPKTGTTSIQECLYINRDRLAGMGLRFADRLGREKGFGHHKLGRLLATSGPGAFIDQLGRQDAIVSAENLSYIFLRDTEGKLAALADVYDLHVIVFVRRADYLLESAFAQMVKMGMKLNIERFRHAILEPAAIVNSITNVIGDERVSCLLYTDPGFDSWAAFCAAAGFPELPRAEKRANVSMHRRKTLLLSKVAIKKRELAIKLSEHVAACDTVEDDGIRFLASLDKRRSVIRDHELANRDLCERFGLDADYMMAEPDDDWHKPKPITPQEWVDTLWLSRD